MDETCQHLAYREAGDGKSFDTARAFCTVTESFVQPMRADICNARYDLDPATDCEFYADTESAVASDTESETAPDAASAERDAPDADR
ncbi:hypothetical protein C463_03038 [Halorubrum californiense DSM 19288]|uniref:Uncharacterized protein n=1 Tax=Halorubrum californiense DSM 19288 TaxID=1227465 RepID=M0EJK6_9EURY|nr:MULTISPECIES: hypothetical protein [Halorubrum]ELZ47258.1 hypothetical protein C463_03038 [Halorubrum californiense DSM 19288]TKX70131.1 hypothetical protein EXE40_09620 [Halorubrum sp. GN11GM_10-3_MGM]